jgi:hypothetical protein
VLVALALYCLTGLVRFVASLLRPGARARQPA